LTQFAGILSWVNAMSSAGSVTHWLNHLKNGDERAAQQALWDRYFERLAALARVRLRHHPCRVADEEDVVLSALAGYTNPEIARELAVVERTVERKLGRIRTLWSDGAA
jgi:DNA-binding NarL/FixJ family response regulator